MSKRNAKPALPDDTELQRQLAECRRIIAEQARELGETDKFIDAYAAWALSDEQCGGPLFDDMVHASSYLSRMVKAFDVVRAKLSP